MNILHICPPHWFLKHSISVQTGGGGGRLQRWLNSSIVISGSGARELPPAPDRNGAQTSLFVANNPGASSVCCWTAESTYPGHLRVIPDITNHAVIMDFAAEDIGMD